ncbi:MAG TPA: hypothetical protein VLK36_12715 [Gaiellaceae bacterium]|nr:hypothetical protein [Gaiellaceae bacterium]
MSDADSVREEYRPLTARELEILELLLSVDVEGIEELRAQVPHALAARWSCGCASFGLVVDAAQAPRSRNTNSLLSEAASKERRGPDSYFELILWLRDGWLNSVEIVDYVDQHGDQSPQEIPPLDYWEAPHLSLHSQPPA